MGTGISDRYAETWGSRRLSGEVVPGSIEAIRSAALLSLAAARLNIDEDELLKRIGQRTGQNTDALRRVMFGTVPLPVPGVAGLGGVIDALLEGLIDAIGISALIELMTALSGDVSISASSEGEIADAAEEKDRRPGIYENCLLAERVTGEVFHQYDDLTPGHFGVQQERVARKGISRTFEVTDCGAMAQQRAFSLFESLSTGYIAAKLLPPSSFFHFGIMRILEDGTVVSYRWETGTETSPAVEIRKPSDPRVKDHKIHFLMAGSLLN